MSRILTDYKLPIINKVMARFFREPLQVKYFRKFYQGISYPQPTKGTVLIYAGIGYTYITPLEILLYHLLRKEGYGVEYYIYDETIPAHELITQQVIQRHGREKYLINTVRKARLWLKAAGVSFKHIQEDALVDTLINPIKENLQAMLDFKYDGVHFGNIIRGAMYRYYRSLSFGEDAANCGHNYLRTALTNYLQVKKLNEQNAYQFILFSHGINCTWEPVVEYCNKYKVKFLCYDRAKRIASANFNINQQSPVWNFDDAWKRYARRALTELEEGWVDDYMKKRELHTGDVYAYNLAKRENDLAALRDKLNIRKGAKVLTVFTNLIWDAANVSRDIAFKSALECIEETIKRYADDERVHILLRPHPAERIIGTDESYEGLVRASFKNTLPSNYSVIDPVEVNSFSVIDITDIGVVNTSTVGLELAMLGKPAILISDTHYRDKGFTSDATSREDYFVKVEYWLGKPDAPIPARLARKYFYMMMNLYQKNTPLIMDNNTFNGYSYRHFTDIMPNDDVLRVIQSLEDVNRKDFIFWD